MMYNRRALIARSHDPNSYQSRAKKSYKIVILEDFHCSVCYVVRALLLSGVTTTPVQLPGNMAEGS